MLGELKTLFDNKFFENALKIKPINDRSFTIKHFTNDSRIQGAALLYCFVGIKGQKFDGNDFFDEVYQLGTRVFVLNKIPSHIPEDAIIYVVDDTIDSLAKLAHIHKQELQIPHLLITGSVGKTTTRLMLTYILREKYAVHTAKKNWNNEIGLPLTILETNREAKISILEAGMSGKGEIAYLSKIVQPEIAVITNIGYSHAEFLGGIDQVAEAKIEITEGMNPNSLLVINKNDPYKEFFENHAVGKVCYFDPNKLTIIDDQGLKGFEFIHQEYPEYRFFCPIPGKHLLLNLSIVFALIDILQIPLDIIQKGLLNILGLDNRMRIFTNNRNISVIADCYNASLESFKASLDVLQKAQGRKIVVIGSVLESGSATEFIHREIGKYINQLNPDLVLAVGSEIKFTCQELTVPYCHFEEKEEIWFVLEKELKAGDTVLIKASHGVGLDILVKCLENLQ